MGQSSRFLKIFEGFFLKEEDKSHLNLFQLCDIDGVSQALFRRKTPTTTSKGWGAHIKMKKKSKYHNRTHLWRWVKSCDYEWRLNITWQLFNTFKYVSQWIGWHVEASMAPHYIFLFIMASLMIVQPWRSIMLVTLSHLLLPLILTERLTVLGYMLKPGAHTNAVFSRCSQLSCLYWAIRDRFLMNVSCKWFGNATILQLCGVSGTNKRLLETKL